MGAISGVRHAVTQPTCRVGAARGPGDVLDLPDCLGELDSHRSFRDGPTPAAQALVAREIPWRFVPVGAATGYRGRMARDSLSNQHLLTEVSRVRRLRVIIGRGRRHELVEILGDFESDRIFIVTGSGAEHEYAIDLQQQISFNHSCHLLVHQTGEPHKNLKTLGELVDAFLAHGGSRSSIVVSVGGGMTGNLAGMLASLCFRGLRLLHLPTTLIAQLDSAIDIKHSVNSRLVKNVIGTLHAPEAVVVDADLLRSLPAREVRSGLAEAVKHAFAQDVSLVPTILSGRSGDPATLERVICSTVKLKLDHYESVPNKWASSLHVERLTHVGHTFGKILEILDPGFITHGEAISIGMAIESRMSSELGLLGEEDTQFIADTLGALGTLVRTGPECTPRNVIGRLYKNSPSPVFALLTGLGTSETVSISPRRSIIESAVEAFWAEQGSST